MKNKTDIKDHPMGAGFAHKDVKKELDQLTKEMSELARDVIKDYKSDNETSGSVTRVHINSPLLSDEQTNE